MSLGDYRNPFGAGDPLPPEPTPAPAPEAAPEGYQRPERRNPWVEALPMLATGPVGYVLSAAGMGRENRMIDENRQRNAAGVQAMNEALAQNGGNPAAAFAAVMRRGDFADLMANDGTFLPYVMDQLRNPNVGPKPSREVIQEGTQNVTRAVDPMGNLGEPIASGPAFTPQQPRGQWADWSFFSSDGDRLGVDPEGNVHMIYQKPRPAETFEQRTGTVIKPGGDGKLVGVDQAGNPFDIYVPPDKPTAFQERVDALRKVYPTEEQAIKAAAGQFVIGQLTNNQTGITRPILIDKVTSTGTVVGEATTLSAEEVNQARASGALQGEVPMTEALAGNAEGADGPPLSSTETMKLGEAVEVGTGSVANTAQRLADAATGLTFEGVQDQDLLDAKAAIADIKLLGAAFVRDEAGTARLTGVNEIDTMNALLPKTDFWTSREENITNLIKLRSRVSEDMELYKLALSTPDAYSPKEYATYRSKVETGQRMLSRLGTREQLFAAQQRIKQNPQAWGRIGRMMGLVKEDASKAVKRATNALPSEQLNAAQFEALLGRVEEGETPDEAKMVTDPHRRGLLADARRKYLATQGAK